MKYCPECGAKIEEIRKFCPECGFNFSTPDEPVLIIEDKPSEKLEEKLVTNRQNKKPDLRTEVFGIKSPNITPGMKSPNIMKVRNKSSPDVLGILLIIIGIVLFIVGVTACFINEYRGMIDDVGVFVQPYLPVGIILIPISIALFVYGVYRIKKI